MGDFAETEVVDGSCFGRHLVAVEEDWTCGSQGYSEDWAERVGHCCNGWLRHLGLVDSSSARPLWRRLRQPILHLERQWRRWSLMGHFLIVAWTVFAAHSVVVAR